MVTEKYFSFSFHGQQILATMVVLQDPYVVWSLITIISHIDTDIQNIDIDSLPKEALRHLEADSYWCMTKLLERIQEDYVFSQPGIQRKIKALEDLIKRIDSEWIDIYIRILLNFMIKISSFYAYKKSTSKRLSTVNAIDQSHLIVM